MTQSEWTLTKWAERFLSLAEHIATWSKDPSTKVGVVIVDHELRIISTGYNGFPRGVNDDDDRLANRDTRLKMTCHSERNAILFARRDLHGCTIYTTFAPCSACAGMIIQSGITTVVTRPTPPALAERWKVDLGLAEVMFNEAGIELIFINKP